ncbi:MAG: DNA-protecting protein DprA [Chitinophagaceae bacterium]|nr:DNA-protecting protein DprA [Chitinophagaceae bacterium]
MSSELIYQLALGEVPYIGNVHAKKLYETFGSATEIFHACQGDLERVENIGAIKAKSIRNFRNFSEAEREIDFMTKFGIRPLSIVDKNYPQRLLNCFDPPAMLFFLGNANLNASRIVAIVGTRNNTEYGKHFTEELVRSFADRNILVVSGLAFGIDSVAHKSSLKYGIPTVGIVGHGLDTIYPRENTGLAKQIIESGGVLTEFRSKTKPDKHNFPSRNRIVAGISDATIVVESGVKGGSIITANLAWDYNRDVFAVPGRVTDVRSAGCNRLIKEQKAVMLDDPGEFLDIMGWDNREIKRDVFQKMMFPELNADEIRVLEFLRKQDLTAMDDLTFSSGLSSSAVATALLNLEMLGLLKALPGKHFRLQD